jgi:cytoplasmic iron level regulating protein YaaA (DUF328/UPF0246 family)
MLIVLSPAKTLDFESPPPKTFTSKSLQSKCRPTQPVLIDQGAQLAELLKQQTTHDLQNLMGISESLAELNHSRYQSWVAPHPDEGSKPAIFAFQGDVYQGLQAETLTLKQLELAQDQLRILSGLYGVLRPLDRILPYRLEMGTTLPNARGKDLYAFWGDRVTELIAAQMQTNRSRFLLNLASNEYFRVIAAAGLPAPVIAPAFKEFKNGSYKMISFFAKKARGTMAAWVIRNRVKTPAKLLQFAEDGYRYDAATSTQTVPVFVRD